MGFYRPYGISPLPVNYTSPIATGVIVLVVTLIAASFLGIGAIIGLMFVN